MLIDALLTLLVVLPVAASVTWLLAAARLPADPPARVGTGAATVGGIVAGILLGPAILGAALPATHERLFLGAAEQRIASEQTTRRADATLAALRATGVSPDAITEAAEEINTEVADARDKLAAARREHLKHQHTWIALPIATIAACLACWRSKRARGRASGAPAPTDRASLPLPRRIASISLYAAFIAVTALALRPFLPTWPAAACLALGLSIIGPMTSPRLSPNSITPLIPLATIAATLLLCSPGLFTDAPSFVFALVALALIVTRHVFTFTVRLRRFARRLAMTALLPTIIALALARLDVLELLTTREFIVPFIVILIVGAELRAAALRYASRVASPTATLPSWTSVAERVNASTGLTQAAVGALLLAPAMWSDQPEHLGIALALVLGGALIELTRGLRLQLATMLDAPPRSPAH